MRIGELAKRAGVSTSKIRFYEARGLIPPAERLPNGYRDYGERALRIVTFVDRAQGLGFTLREVAVHLSLPDNEARKARLQRRLETKLAELDAHIAEAKARRETLLKLIDEVQGVRRRLAKA